eukprot:gene4336-4589_t
MLNSLRYISPAFYARKAGHALGLPPSFVTLLGATVAVAGFDVIDLFIEGPEMVTAASEGHFADAATGTAEFTAGGDEMTDHPADDDSVVQLDEVDDFLSGCELAHPDGTASALKDSIVAGPLLLRYRNPLVGTSITTDTEVLVFKRDGGELVFAFRGTETSFQDGLVEDVTTDALFATAPLSSMLGMTDQGYPEEVKVHKGFLTAFNDVLGKDPDERKLLDVAEEMMDGEKPSRLGGALATLGAFWVAEAGFPGVGTPLYMVELECYAFASPRVGNMSFAMLFNEVVPNCFRFTHKSDVVPAVPPIGWYKHVGRPVMLIEPADNDYGLLGCCEEGEDPTAEYEEGEFLALLQDRPLLGAYLGVADHSMKLYLQAMASILGCEQPPEDAAADIQEAALMAGLLSVGVFGAAVKLRPGKWSALQHQKSAKSVADLQSQVQWSVAPGKLPDEMQPRMPEQGDLFHALNRRASKVRLKRYPASQSVPHGWRMATCADVLTHMHKAWNTVSASKPTVAQLKDGTLSITSSLFTSKMAEVHAGEPNAELQDMLLISEANTMSPAVLKGPGGLINSMIEAEEGQVVRGVLCGEVSFLLSKNGANYAGYRLAKCAENKTWVALSDGYVRRATVTANIGNGRILRVQEDLHDSTNSTSAWKLLVRNCDVDKVHKQLVRLHPKGSRTNSGTAEGAAGAHAQHPGAWRLLPSSAELEQSWRMASCWEVLSLLPYSTNGNHLLKASWNGDCDTFISLLDGHLHLPKDAGEGDLIRISCREKPLHACAYQLAICAPVSISPDQQLFIDSVHTILINNQGSVTMAAAPAAAVTEAVGWLAMVRHDAAAVLPGYHVLSYDTAIAAKDSATRFGQLLRVMLINSHHTGSVNSKALLAGGSISLPFNVTRKDYFLKRALLKLQWKADADVDLQQDVSTELSVLLRQHPQV